MHETDETPTDTDDRVSTTRRSYLTGIAGAVALGIAGTGTAAADASDERSADDEGGGADTEYDVIEVAAGDTYTVQLGDGETLENELIDITADGAQYQLTAIGSDWTIRNVGVRGAWDAYEKAEPLIASVPDSNGSARIENVYLGDGAPDNTYPGATGIYVAKKHAGVLKVDHANIQDYPDNAIYGSSPGDSSNHPSGSGGQGEVHITNSYAANCRSGGFRVGTEGSYAKNCVAVGCDRNFWGFYSETEAIDCDFSDGQIGDVGTGDGQWGADATVRLTNTRFETTVEHSGQVVGDAVADPQRTEPEDVAGVPLSPADAASSGTDAGIGAGDED